MRRHEGDKGTLRAAGTLMSSVAADAGITRKVPPELEAKLTRLATETGRTVAQVALDLLASYLSDFALFGLLIRRRSPLQQPLR